MKIIFKHDDKIIIEYNSKELDMVLQSLEFYISSQDKIKLLEMYLNVMDNTCRGLQKYPIY